MNYFMLALVLLSSLWVYVDAKSIGVRKGILPGMLDADPGTWALGCVLMWIVVFPAYLWKRGEYRERIAIGILPAESSEAGCGPMSLAVIVFVLLTVIGGLFYIGPQ